MTEEQKATTRSKLEKICLDNDCAEYWEALSGELAQHTKDFVYCPFCSEELNLQCGACGGHAGDVNARLLAGGADSDAARAIRRAAGLSHSAAESIALATPLAGALAAAVAASLFREAGALAVLRLDANWRFLLALLAAWPALVTWLPGVIYPG